MKLLYCKKCGNIFNLILYEEKSCECGSTKGKYVDMLNAEYSGEFAVPLAVWNSTFIRTITFQPEEDIPESSGGRPMTWYVVPKKCKTFRRTA